VLYLYRVAIFCTRNGSPRGQFTLFLRLQYGQTAMRSTSFPSPVDPTTRIPFWHFVQRKIFCNYPPSRPVPLGGPLQTFP